MSRDKEIITSTLLCNGQEPHSTISDAISSLPNQIKSLMLDSTANSTVVKRSYFGSTPDAAKSAKSSASYKMNYQMINRIEYLAGFEVSESGLHIKSPVWKPLTNESYGLAAGEGLLCRQMAYENPKLGIVQDKGIELPIFNEYFLITPAQKASTTSRTTATTKYGSKSKITDMLIKTTKSSAKVGKKFKNTNLVANGGSRSSRKSSTQRSTGTGGY